MLDRRLPQSLAIGSDLDADGTPPVVSMIPKHKGATEHLAPLDTIMSDTVGRGWISEGREHPHYLPAHISPISCVPKHGSNKFRKVGDYGNPRDGKTAAALGAFSVPPNPNCRFGPEFVQVWGNPQQLCAMVGIYTQPLEGSRFSVAMACRDL